MTSVAAIQLTKRQHRLLAALVRHHQFIGDARWICREDTDRICGASNSPQNVMELRRKLGEAAILMRKVDATNRDGKPIKRGEYGLSEHGLRRLKEIGWNHGN